MFEVGGLTVVLGSFAAGTASLVLSWYLLRHRGQSGATWFIVTLLTQALAAFAYGSGLLTFDPTWRMYAEAITWIGIAWIGPTFLAFALAYTGRTKALSSSGFHLLMGFPVVGTIVSLTHPYHSLLWTDFEISPVFELSTVLYTIQPTGYIIATMSLVTVGTGILLLLETILSYGPLYKREAIAVAVSTIPPAIGFIIWLLGIGPWPALNLAIVLLLPHIAFDAYAFAGTHMFETAPATRRAAERKGLSTIKTPILTIDSTGQVVDINSYAEDVFDVTSRDILPIYVRQLMGMDLDTLRSTGELEIDGSEGGTFVVSYSPFEDEATGSIGGMLTLSDITEERQRKQRLNVLNRVLRHNLRNEMTVIKGRAELVVSDASDDQLITHGDAIVESSDRLLSIAENMRDFERIQDQSNQRVSVSIDEVIDDIIGEVTDRLPNATVSIDITTSEAAVQTYEGPLRLLLTNLIENAIIHSKEQIAEVSVHVYDTGPTGDEVAIEVGDSNQRISEEEIGPLRIGNETALQHGSGVGLWIIKWCLTSLNGEVRFEYDEGNIVTVTLPRSD